MNAPSSTVTSNRAAPSSSTATNSAVADDKPAVAHKPAAEPAVSAAPRMELVVRGRNVVVPDHYRQHVLDKLARIERYDHKIIRTDVELQHERNPRQNGSCQHVEITCRTRGPVVRSEACAEDFYKALDLAAERLERRLRQAADRRRVHHGRRTPKSLYAAVCEVEPEARLFAPPQAEEELPEDGPGRVVRVKEHPAVPMSVDDALFEMELVGHDFYLFFDKVSSQPSVVYRRHAYDYGLIRLGTDQL